MIYINLSSLPILGLKPNIIEFPNGEFKVVLEGLTPTDEYVIIVQTDQNPMKMIFATAMILDIIQNVQPKPEKVYVVHPWLSFSRQDKRFLPSEPLTLNLLLKWYESLGVTDLLSFDIHAVQFRNPGITLWGNHLRVHNINFITQFYDPKLEIMSPTSKDEPFLLPLQEKNVDITYFEKEKFCKRCGKKSQLCTCGGKMQLEIRLTPSKKIDASRVLLIDDIISGGGTMLAAVKILKESGVQYIEVAATHGFFNGNEAKQIFQEVQKIRTSNIVTPQLPQLLKDKLEINDCSQVLINYINKLKNEIK